MTAVRDRAIVVTGASTGIGKAAVLALLDAGFTVLAGVRNARAADLLRGDVPPAAAGRLETLQLDVTDGAHIQAAVAQVERRAGEAGLWGLFNNAGISVAGPMEHATDDDLRRQFDVNVIGQAAVTRAFIPLLRRARGRILITGSTSGFIAVPGLGAYSMSKYAMEAFSDTLRRELRPWGIEVLLLQPGTIATEIWGKGLSQFDDLMRAPPAGVIENYGGLLNSMHEVAVDSARRATPATVVARDVVHAFAARRPRTRYCMGTDARVQRWISRLPDRWADRLLAKFFHWG
jgi:NAD(P)-dependent dehydrogenase (short-subunit alcohol dehydrogenase family)